MNQRADAAQIRRWQEEVAGDPGCPAFIPLAEVYRREGRLDVARRLCLRGLERNPEHVDAHVLLGRVYRESGELEKALDEWDIALRLDDAHRVARRALGFLLLERRDWAGAARHLELASQSDPGDDRLRSALALARRHAAAGDGTAEMDPSTALLGPVSEFARETRVRAVLVIDSTGRILLRHGAVEALDLAGLASLAAGVHAASGALARMLRQPAFEQLYQGAGEHQIFLGPLSGPEGELILVAIFGTDATIGLVRVRFDQLASRVETLSWMPAAAAAPSDALAYEARLQSGLASAAGEPRPQTPRS